MCLTTRHKVGYYNQCCSLYSHKIDFEGEIKKITNGVDLVIDFIGTNYFLQNVNVLRLDGTLYSLAFMSGAKFPEGASMAPFLGKRLTFKGSTLRSRSPEYQAKLLKTFEEKILPKILDDTMKVKVHEVSSPALVYIESTYVNILSGLPLVQGY